MFYSLFRFLITPLDTIKTTLQVEGDTGYDLLLVKIRGGGASILWNGALANTFASFISSYPWYLAFNILDMMLPKGDSLLRTAAMSFISTCVSDLTTNSIRVIKTVKQVSRKQITYRQALSDVIKKDGISGVFCRGLGTRMLTNTFQSMLFSVVWKRVECYLNSAPSGSTLSTVDT